MIIDGNTQLYAIIGHPIAQVGSPTLLTARLQAAGRNAVLIPLHILPDDFESTTRALMRLQNLQGLVITLPYKHRALALADHVRPAAAAIGAANALRRTAAGWEADMFDGAGLVRALQAEDVPLQGASASILGAGGAGSAIAMALANAGAARLILHDPHPGTAAALAARIARHHPACQAYPGQDPADTAGHTLLINCTPIGMGPNPAMPAPFAPFPPTLFVADIITQPELTPLRAHALASGCRTLNGHAMLEAQADALLDYFTP